jgi:hypothetical protein
MIAAILLTRFVTDLGGRAGFGIVKLSAGLFAIFREFRDGAGADETHLNPCKTINAIKTQENIWLCIP